MNAPERLTQVAYATKEATERRNGQTDFDRLMQRSFTPIDILEDNNFDKLWRMAESLANSALSIPKELKGNIGDCLAIVTQAMIWGLNPFGVAQKAHVINGKLGYEAQLVNAVVMQSGAIQGSFHYEYEGDRCRVGAVLRGESTITWGEWLSAATVTTKNSPLWKTNPKQQMGYLQVKNWARAYCPGALLGIYSSDELETPDTSPFAPGAESQGTLPKAPPLPAYQAADFEANLPEWKRKLIDTGKKTAPELLAMLSTKATFTEEQQAKLLSLKKPPPAAETPPPPPPRPPAPAPTTAAALPTGDEWVDEFDATEGAAQ